MARKFSELRGRMSPAARVAVDKEFQRLIAEMPLRQLRAARALTQEKIANILSVRQSEVSKIERRTDMYLSTLAAYIKAMGGELEIRAVFPKGEVVRISQFSSSTGQQRVTRKKGEK